MNNKLFFLSRENLDNKILEPRVPKNFFTENGFEDSITKRVCFAPSIDKSLMAISQALIDTEFYVHVPNNNNYKIYKPKLHEVPDSKITGEIWITQPVKIRCIGKIKVIGDSNKPGHKFTYGDKYEAELYEWDWKWIEKINIKALIDNYLSKMV